MNRFLRWRWRIFLAGAVVYAFAITAGYFLKNTAFDLSRRIALAKFRFKRWWRKKIPKNY